jgi:hypothetical protein
VNFSKFKIYSIVGMAIIFTMPFATLGSTPEKRLYVGFKNGDVVNFESNSSNLSPAEFVKQVSARVDITESIFMYFDYKALNTTVVLGEAWNGSRKELASLDSFYPNLIDKNFNQNLLVITPPCHYANRTPSDASNGLECWANLAKEKKLISSLESFTKKIVAMLPQSFHASSGKICYLGNSRFGWFALTQAPLISPQNAQSIFILIAPVINPLSLSEFNGVAFDNKLPKDFLKNSIIFAGTRLIDQRVGAHNLFTLALSLNSQKFILDILSGEGHDYSPTNEMLSFFKGQCTH